MNEKQNVYLKKKELASVIDMLPPHDTEHPYGHRAGVLARESRRRDYSSQL